jgi:hypothetical protein
VAVVAVARAVPELRDARRLVQQVVVGAALSAVLAHLVVLEVVAQSVLPDEVDQHRQAVWLAAGPLDEELALPLPAVSAQRLVVLLVMWVLQPARMELPERLGSLLLVLLVSQQVERPQARLALLAPQRAEPLGVV